MGWATSVLAHGICRLAGGGESGPACQCVVDLADAAARSRGYDLSEYQRPEPQYDPADGAWSLLYDRKPVDGTTEIGKHFNVAVDDKTKRTVLVAGN